MKVDNKITDFPPGVAYVESVGWETDLEHGRRFVARLCFPAGAPDIADLSVRAVVKRLPVKIIEVRK